MVWRYFYDQSHKPPDRRVTIGELQIYLTAFASLQANLSILFQMSNFKAAAQAGVERIAAVLKTASTTPDPIGYEAVIPEHGQIVCCNVTFGYDPDRPVLKDVNLTIPYGQRVALVGPSGAGKSTITQLLLRLYDPDQGAILIGGLNIRHCQGAELRRRFGVVPQDPFIFSTSIRDNLCVARTGGDGSRTSAGRASWPMPGNLSPACRMAWRRRWAKGDRRFPAGSGSGWRSRGRCWPSRIFSSSMKRPARSIPSARNWCRRRWKMPWRARQR